MPEFAWPWVFVLLPLPWLVWRWLPAAPIHAALRLPQRGLDRSERAAIRHRRWPVACLLAWLLLVCAAARPQQLGAVEEPPRTGRAVMLAIDISGSMLEQDMVMGGRRVSRFVATRAIVSDFISRREGDELGLIVFGSEAYLITPLTWDLTTVRAQLEGSAVGLAGRQTAIGDAIAVGVRRLAHLPDEARVLILLTDGVNNAGHVSPEQASLAAKDAGVRIYTIGIGSESGPMQDLFGGLFASQDDTLDVDSLTRIAESTGGRFYRAEDTAQLAEAWRSIDRLEPVRQEARPLRPRRELFRWPLGAAVGLVLLGLAVPSRRATERWRA